MNDKKFMDAKERVERAQLMCDSVSRKIHDGSVFSSDLMSYWNNELTIARDELGVLGGDWKSSEPQNHKEELKYEGAYREVCRMASLLANVMSGHVIDSINSKVIVPEVDIKMDKLEEILTISHKLYDLSPSTLSEHDDFLNEMRRCLDGFSESLGVPVPSPIICYDQSLYESRLRAIDVGKG